MENINESIVNRNYITDSLRKEILHMANDIFNVNLLDYQSDTHDQNDQQGDPKEEIKLFILTLATNNSLHTFFTEKNLQALSLNIFNSKKLTKLILNHTDRFLLNNLINGDDELEELCSYLASNLNLTHSEEINKEYNLMPVKIYESVMLQYDVKQTLLTNPWIIYVLYIQLMGKEIMDVFYTYKKLIDRIDPKRKIFTDLKPPQLSTT